MSRAFDMVRNDSSRMRRFSDWARCRFHLRRCFAEILLPLAFPAAMGRERKDTRHNESSDNHQSCGHWCTFRQG